MPGVFLLVTSDLIYGGRVIQHLDSIPEIGSTLIIVRHSERPSFGGMPVEEWDFVTINERGRSAATSFGRALAERRKDQKLDVRSWGLRRCVETAECIAAGAKEVGYHAPQVTPLGLRGPVSDIEAYNDLMRRGVWTEMLTGWLGRGAYESMVPMNEYASEVLSALLNSEFHARQRGDTTIIATHDINILPLATFLHKRPVMKVDFLDGIVLKSDGVNVHVGFESSSTLVAHTLFAHRAARA